MLLVTNRHVQSNLGFYSILNGKADGWRRKSTQNADDGILYLDFLETRLATRALPPASSSHNE
jgi:hypothetical protein